MRERAVLLESLFLIRIGSRDPGPHILAKQCLVGADIEPFAFCGIHAIAATALFFSGDGLFFIFTVDLRL